MPDSIPDHLSDWTIAEELIRLRTLTTAKRHEAAFFSNMSSDAKHPADVVSSQVDELLPSRRMWRRPSRAHRSLLEKPAMIRDSITRAVRAQVARDGLHRCDWGRRLMNFCDAVRARASGRGNLEIPTVKLISKDKAKNTFRIIASYDQLEDRVLLRLMNRYLTSVFDDDLLPCAYAFRAKTSLTRTAATRGLRAFRMKHLDGDVFAAECDIQKFFDVVNHAVARRALQQAVERLERRGGRVDADALAIVDRYLGSYTSHGAQQIAEGRRHMEGRKGGVDRVDPATMATIYPHGVEQRMGLPQGGALSPLLANLILDAADRAVVEGSDRENLFYARFCDDMVLVHPDAGRCREAFDRYRSTLADLKLPAHHPVDVERYDASFFNTKSKNPYKWGAAGGRLDVVPWVSFLGYHIKYDGKLRVRHESVVRQEHKQIELIGNVLRLVTKRPDDVHMSAKEIVARTRLKLIAMSIGLNRLRVAGAPRVQPCWADAFCLLDMNLHSTVQLQSLDRSRERQLRRLIRQLREVKLLADGAPTEPDTMVRRTRFFGAPYSYYGAIGPSERKDIRVPLLDAYVSLSRHVP